MTRKQFVFNFICLIIETVIILLFNRFVTVLKNKVCYVATSSNFVTFCTPTIFENVFLKCCYNLTITMKKKVTFTYYRYVKTSF